MSGDTTEYGKLIDKCISQSNILDQIITKQQEYIALLGEECSEYASYMSARQPGWESSRYERGDTLRNELRILTERLNEIKNGSNISKL